MKIELQLSYLCLLLLLSCQSAVNEEQLKEYIKDPEHGLLIEKKYGDLKVQAIYKPTDLVLAGDQSADSTQKENYKKHYYFLLNISNKGQELEASYAGNAAVFESQLKKMVYGMHQAVMIVNDQKDTLGLKDYMYPRMFGGTGHSSFILAFDNAKLKNAKWFELIVNYPELGLVGEKFRFMKEDLDNIPLLKQE